MSNVTLVSITDIAAKAKVAPKLARRRLRAYDGKAKLPQSRHHRNWVWTPVEAKKIEAVVRGDAA